MKKEELITLEELNALLAANGEEFQVDGTDEPIGAQHLISLQKAVLLLSRQVETLQLELHEQFHAQHKQQEQLFRQFTHLLERQLHRQLVKGLPPQMTPEYAQVTEPQASESTPEEWSAHPAVVQEPQTYSRMKSYGKIRKRRKSFLEKLFE